MSMQKPLNVDEVAKNKKAAKEKRAKYTVGLVTPNGQMMSFYCPPPDDGGDNGPKNGDAPVCWMNGEPQVLKRYKAAGYVLYTDLAAADGEPEKAERWHQAMAARILGTPIRGDVDALYSKSVLERRAQSAAGSRGSGGKAFDIDKGEIVDDPEAKKRRVAGLLQEAAGITVPEANLEPDNEPDNEPEAKPTTSKTTRKASK